MDSQYTTEDLRIMQKWPLEQKIQVTQTRILEWMSYWKDRGGGAYVSFSGGKDSTVLLDLARRIDSSIPAVFIDTGLEYPEIREFALSQSNVIRLVPERYNRCTKQYERFAFDKVIREYGYPVVSKEISECIYYAQHNKSWALNRINGKNPDGSVSAYKQKYKKWAYLVGASFKVSHYCCHIMKKHPAKKYEKESGNKPIIATMAVESILREKSWLKNGCNAFNGRRPISTPMSFWTEQDVLHYLKRFHIPFSSIYGDIVEERGMLKTTGESRTGCMFCMFGVHLEKEPNRFQRMALTHPKQWNYCINKLGCGAVLDYIGVPYKPIDNAKA